MFQGGNGSLELFEGLLATRGDVQAQDMADLGKVDPQRAEVGEVKVQGETVQTERGSLGGALLLTVLDLGHSRSRGTIQEEGDQEGEGLDALPSLGEGKCFEGDVSLTEGGGEFLDAPGLCGRGAGGQRGLL